jgi:hypothetical protein
MFNGKDVAGNPGGRNCGQLRARWGQPTGGSPVDVGGPAVPAELAGDIAGLIRTVSARTDYPLIELAAQWPNGRNALNLGAAPARGEGGGRGVQLRGVELNRVVGSGGVETDMFTVDP